MPALRWERDREGRVWTAYSGDLAVGIVVKVTAAVTGGPWRYSVTAVHTRYITRGAGDVGTARQGRRSLGRAWRDWCRHAGLAVEAREV